MEPTKDGAYTSELKMGEGPMGSIEGWGIPFGGPINGGDLDGERFTPKTDFRFDWFPDGRPMLYDHGTDAKLGLDLIGRQTDHEVMDEVGVWVKGQINMSHRYADAVMTLIDQKQLGLSSLAMRHLIERDGAGNIKVWPWIEQTLTVHPANPAATIDEFKMNTTFADAMKQLGLDIPEGLITSPDPKPAEKSIELPDGMSTDDLRDALLVSAKDGYPSLFDGEHIHPWVDVVFDGKFVVSADDHSYEVDYEIDDGKVSVSGAPRAVVRRTVFEPEAKSRALEIWTPPTKKAGTFLELADSAKTSLTDVEAFIGNAEQLVAAVREKDEKLTDSKRVVLADLGVGVQAVSERLAALLAEQKGAEPPSTDQARPSWRVRSMRLQEAMEEFPEPVEA